MFSEIICVISGKVQRVGYRDFVLQAAKRLELTGYVRNKEDGTVEILAQGLPDDLKLFIEELHEGSVLAEVESVSADWRSPKEQYDDFGVLF
jgi:acylphosphatase